MVTHSLRPKQVATAAGVSTDTLRYYERLGLLRDVLRTPAGCRIYPATAIARVQLIQCALVIGFSLRDLRRILAICDRGAAPCTTVRSLLGERIETLKTRIDRLHALQDELSRLADDWDDILARTPAGRPAHLLETLAARPFVENARQLRARRTLPGQHQFEAFGRSTNKSA